MPRTLLNKKFLKLKFNYVIGHGMAFKNEVIKKIGGYPEDEINEDNVLGYRLNKENIAIYAIPILEKIGFAKKTSVYIQQQSVWYNGPLYAFQYFSKILDRCSCFRERLRMFFVACLNFKNALNWNIFSLVTFISIIGSVIVKKYYYIIIIVLCLILYVYGLNWYTEKVLLANKYLQKKAKVSITNLFIEVIFWLIIHSTGPMLTLGKIVTNRNKQSNKYKTEK